MTDTKDAVGVAKTRVVDALDGFDPEGHNVKVGSKSFGGVGYVVVTINQQD